MFWARMFAATEPGFLANQHIEVVNLNGGHLGYCLAIGLNFATPEGRDAVNYQAALLIFCYQLRDLGVGHIPFNPAPHHPDPAGPGAMQGGLAGDAHDVPANAGQGPVDHDFVQILGGVHPVFGAWVEPEEEEVVIVGGVHPVHGPWVEGQQLPPAQMDMDNLIDELWEELFPEDVANQGGAGDQEPVNQEPEPNFPDN
jgi:hypothetical protein